MVVSHQFTTKELTDCGEMYSLVAYLDLFYELEDVGLLDLQSEVQLYALHYNI